MAAPHEAAPLPTVAEGVFPLPLPTVAEGVFPLPLPTVAEGVFPLPLPTITIVLMPQPGGGYVPQATITQMPGGWATAHEALCLTLNQVAHQMVEAHARAPHIQLATRLPGSHGGSL